MTLTSTYQYLGRSSALKSQNGSYSYYLLLYGASSGLSNGKHHISIKLRLACTEGSSFYGFSTSGAASAGGQTAFSWSWEPYPNAPWNTTALTEGGVTYPRWIDLRENAVQIYTGYGAEKTVDLSGSFTFCDGTSGYLPQKSKAVTVSVSCVLSAIAGASKPSCAATCELGKSLAITVTGQNGMTHTLRYRFGTAEGVISGTVWTPPLSLASQIPNAASGTATIYCDTYSGSTPIGTEQTTVTLTVPASVVPTVSAAVTDASVAEGRVGCLVQGFSKLQVVPNAQGAYGSTILSTSVLLDGKAYTGGILTESGDHTVTVTATDSRRRTASFEKAITVAPYQAPALKLSASRCAADGTPDETGDHAKITVTGSITSLSTGNRAALNLYWGNSSQSFGNVTSCSKIVPADVNATMAIRATLSDKLVTTERSMTLSTGYATLDLLAGGRGIAFGKAATREGFDCAMPAYFTGGVSGISASDVGARPDTWTPTAAAVGARPATWTPTAAEVGAAPSGFGLGEVGGQSVGDCDSVFKNGFYLTNSATLNIPATVGAYGGMLEVHSYAGNHCVQIFYQTAYSKNSHIAIRKFTNAAWSPWEWLNSPMFLSYGYQTVFRRNGKPVFRKLISFGTLPASGEKNVSTGLAFDDYEIVDCSVQLLHSGGEYVYFLTPQLTFGFYKKAVNGVDYWHATAEVGIDLSAYTVAAQISYVEKG